MKDIVIVTKEEIELLFDTKEKQEVFSKVIIRILDSILAATGNGMEKKQ